MRTWPKIVWVWLKWKGEQGVMIMKPWRKPELWMQRQTLSWLSEDKVSVQFLVFFLEYNLHFDTLWLSTAHLYVIQLEPLGRKRSYRLRKRAREGGRERDRESESKGTSLIRICFKTAFGSGTSGNWKAESYNNWGATKLVGGID